MRLLADGGLYTAAEGYAMYAALKMFSGGERGANRWRRLSAVVGAVALSSAGAVLVASPAQADQFKQACGTFHSWTECVSFDYTNGNLAVNATNGYSTSQTESLSISFMGANSYNIITTQGFVIPAGGSRGFSYHWGSTAPSAPVCGQIDDVVIVCSNF